MKSFSYAINHIFLLHVFSHHEVEDCIQYHMTGEELHYLLILFGFQPIPFLL